MPDPKLDLEIVRFVAATRAKVWQAWSDPNILKQWWCPKPWMTEVRAFDFRSGGAFHTFMSGPDGGESDNPGLFLEVVPMERIIWTSMLVAGWRPATPWLGMTGIFTLAMKAPARATRRAVSTKTMPIARSMKTWASLMAGGL